jgi:hypothetical protein
MNVVKWSVRVGTRERGTWAILPETRENRPQMIVTELLTHLSLNKPACEQDTAEENARDTFVSSSRERLTRHCLANSIQPDPLCRTWCSTHSSVGNTGPSVASMSGGINWRTR